MEAYVSQKGNDGHWSLLCSFLTTMCREYTRKLVRFCRWRMDYCPSCCVQEDSMNQ